MSISACHAEDPGSIPGGFTSLVVDTVVRCSRETKEERKHTGVQQIRIQIFVVHGTNAPLSMFQSLTVSPKTLVCVACLWNGKILIPMQPRVTGTKDEQWMMDRHGHDTGKALKQITKSEVHALVVIYTY